MTNDDLMEDYYDMHVNGVITIKEFYTKCSEKRIDYCDIEEFHEEQKSQGYTRRAMTIRNKRKKK